MIINWEEFQEYRDSNDHSWYEDEILVAPNGNKFLIRNFDYKKYTYEYFDYDGKKEWQKDKIDDDDIKFSLAQLDYLRSKSIIQLSRSLRKIRERF